jgi:hypothetical protein
MTKSRVVELGGDEDERHGTEFYKSAEVNLVDLTFRGGVQYINHRILLRMGVG